MRQAIEQPFYLILVLGATELYTDGMAACTVALVLSSA